MGIFWDAIKEAVSLLVHGDSYVYQVMWMSLQVAGISTILAVIGLLVFLAGFRNRIAVFANWAWNWFTWDRGPRLIFRRRDGD